MHRAHWRQGWGGNPGSLALQSGSYATLADSFVLPLAQDAIPKQSTLSKPCGSQWASEIEHPQALG